jgi:benzoate-CoA ligase
MHYTAILSATMHVASGELFHAPQERIPGEANMGGLVTPLTGPYNAAFDLIGRNLASRPEKTAYIDADGAYTYREMASRADMAGSALLDLGLKPGDRVLLCLFDGIDFVSAFLGAIWIGVMPIALNTLLRAEDYAYVLADSEARAAIVSAPLLEGFEAAVALTAWPDVLLVSGDPLTEGQQSFSDLMARASRSAPLHPSRAEDVAFWLYSSGSTGRPKGAPHRHSSLMASAELFGQGVLGLKETDVIYSTAKLFFAYGLGAGLTFPLSVGATTVLHPGRVTPPAAGQLLQEHQVTVFFGAPTFFASMLASPDIPSADELSLRLCVSAGEALPKEIGQAWTDRTGVEIVDGIGSTEMLHIYVSNRPGEVRYGATGHPVPGYDVRLAAEHGGEAQPGELGELLVRGPTMTTGYWNQPEKTAATFVDGWMRTGDKFRRTEDGWLIHCGRADDMLKVSGLWVSPMEVENALLGHDKVLEAAVIGVTDPNGLTKTKAFIVARDGIVREDALADELKAFTKSRLAPHKYPRLIEFVDSLPKTATGKIRRHVLREREAARALLGGAA